VNQGQQRVPGGDLRDVPGLLAAVGDDRVLDIVGPGADAGARIASIRAQPL